MKDIIEVCYQYGFKELKKCLLKAIGTNYWCDTSDKDLEEFKKKHNLPVSVDYLSKNFNI